MNTGLALVFFSAGAFLVSFVAYLVYGDVGFLWTCCCEAAFAAMGYVIGKIEEKEEGGADVEVFLVISESVREPDDD